MCSLRLELKQCSRLVLFLVERFGHLLVLEHHWGLCPVCVHILPARNTRLSHHHFRSHKYKHLHTDLPLLPKLMITHTHARTKCVSRTQRCTHTQGSWHVSFVMCGRLYGGSSTHTTSFRPARMHSRLTCPSHTHRRTGSWLTLS